MDFPGIRDFPASAPRLVTKEHVSAFADAIAPDVTTKGAAGGLTIMPGILPTRSQSDRMADRMYAVFFGDDGDLFSDAARRSIEMPSIHIHLDSAIIGIESRYSDELARMRELHSDDELRAITRAGAGAAFEEIKRGDIVGFLPQFEANVMAAMNKKSREILQERRDNAPLPPLAGPQRPLEWNEENRTSVPQSSLELDGERDSWQPGDVTIPSGSPDPEINWPALEIDPPSAFQPRRLPDLEGWQMDPEAIASQQHLEQMRNERIKRPTPDFSDFGFDGAGAPVLPGRDPIVQNPASLPEDMTRDGLERLFERFERIARETIERSLGHSSFTDGTDPIAEAIERHGVFLAILLHAIAADLTPEQIAGGAADAMPAPSAAMANQLRGMSPEAAAALTNQIGARIADVPLIYREALAAALAAGDRDNPDIARAIQFLDTANSAGNTPDARRPLTVEELTLLDRQIARGRLTMEQFEHFRDMNPQLPVPILIHRIGRFNLGEDVEGLRAFESDPVPDIPPASDLAPAADLVHSWADIRTLLNERYGMRLSNGIEDAAGLRLTRHSEEEMRQIVNAAIPYLDRLETTHPGLLRGLSIDVHSPNPRGILPTMPGSFNGLSNLANGTIYLTTPQDFRQAYIDRPIDGDTKFMLTLYHEIGHAISAKAPVQARDFMRNLSPVIEIRGPESSDAGPDAVTMDEALATLFPHLDVDRAYERLWQNYAVRIDDVELMQMETAGEYIPPTREYYGTLHLYRRMPVDVTDVMGIGTSGYAATKPEEALAEAFAHDFADRPYRNYPDAELPRLVEATRGPLPANLQSLLNRMIYVARHRDEPVAAPPYPEFRDE